MNEGVAWIHEQLRRERWLDELRRRARSVGPDGEIRPPSPRRRETEGRGRTAADS